ncbi:cob(I)yrinic acid a,c-diamide adenosyltransferase [Jeotgalibaca ciconiae]|uniref:Corrinoid adenosyltransferase n=1 Tax=Jeotgalibaca ciconiae TaxID=2496265 RepID=A0A3Q9BLU6_9LACT|nr:cob(I)yrinic acid a,c-diamide adenosyltransferase [Jeotgalibaca ciconiae]AZP03957.1 cob(I)yrinic acid a,c-diamide adenosyltransferase [Jeotgalibaca ciconiae]HJB22527.1 cob(I)yrinic acid a,c-diamide adenosyltransferase [Candidatus Jeotgalibaca pullicola]
MKPSIYTRTGDKGKTRIGGGKAVEKNDARINAFGEVDHINSWCGLVEASLAKNPYAGDIREDIRTIQQFLFDCTSDLSVPQGYRDYKITGEHIEWLEGLVDRYSEEPPETFYFIIPGGTEAASWMHVLRTTTRNAERSLVTFIQEEPEEVNPHVLKFVNRLSDYFFIVARVLNVRNEVADVPYDRSEKVFHVSREKREAEKKNKD